MELPIHVWVILFNLEKESASLFIVFNSGKRIFVYIQCKLFYLTKSSDRFNRKQWFESHWLMFIIISYIISSDDVYEIGYEKAWTLKHMLISVISLYGNLLEGFPSRISAILSIILLLIILRTWEIFTEYFTRFNWFLTVHTTRWY